MKHEEHGMNNFQYQIFIIENNYLLKIFISYLFLFLKFFNIIILKIILLQVSLINNLSFRSSKIFSPE